MDELSDEDKFSCSIVRVVFNSSYLKTSTLLNSLLVKQVHMYLLKKQLKASKKFLKVNMTIFQKMLSVLLVRIEEVVEKAKQMGVEV